MEAIVSRLESIISPVLTQESVELVDLTYQKEGADWFLRFFLDKPGGFSLDDCAKWSEVIGLLLDEHDLIGHPYNLEISSPGIYRVLKKLSDFERFVGKRIKIKLYGPIDGMRGFTGHILGLEENQVLVQLDGNKRLKLSLEQIAKANLDPEINF